MTSQYNDRGAEGAAKKLDSMNKIAKICTESQHRRPIEIAFWKNRVPHGPFGMAFPGFVREINGVGPFKRCNLNVPLL